MEIRRSLTAKCIVVTLAFFIIYIYAKACDCIMTPVEDHVKRSENIIIAKVVSTVIDSSQIYPQNKEVVLEVTKVFKGEINAKQRFTFIPDGNCDPRFRKDEEYLLFCFQQGETYHIYHCSYNDRSATSSKVIKKIERALKK